MNLKKLDFAPSFLKKAGKVIKKNPSLENSFDNLLNILVRDPFSPTIHTHALSGELKGKYACSLTHKLRVVFTLTDDKVHLLDIGSHDEVY